MASGSSNNRGRACQLNLNEMYNGRVSTQPSLLLSQQTPRLKQSKFFPHNIDNKVKLNRMKILGMI